MPEPTDNPNPEPSKSTAQSASHSTYPHALQLAAYHHLLPVDQWMQNSYHNTPLAPTATTRHRQQPTQPSLAGFEVQAPQQTMNLNQLLNVPSSYSEGLNPTAQGVGSKRSYLDLTGNREHKRINSRSGHFLGPTTEAYYTTAESGLRKEATSENTAPLSSESRNTTNQDSSKELGITQSDPKPVAETVELTKTEIYTAKVNDFYVDHNDSDSDHYYSDSEKRRERVKIHYFKDKKRLERFMRRTIDEENYEGFWYKGNDGLLQFDGEMQNGKYTGGEWSCNIKVAESEEMVLSHLDGRCSIVKMTELSDNIPLAAEESEDDY